MLTTRLSSVITGRGSKDTTCSRRSMSGRSRSMNGMRRCSPGSSVRLERPSRSTMPARACGMIRIVRHRTIRTTKATTSRTMSAATTASLFVDEGGCALDADHLDPGAGLEHLMLVPGTGRPHLAADLHSTTLRVHALEDHGRLSHEGSRARAKRGWKPHVAAGDRPNDA